MVNTCRQYRESRVPVHYLTTTLAGNALFRRYSGNADLVETIGNLGASSGELTGEKLKNASEVVGPL